ncbi:MAG TPA: DUF4097 family beta strand repeat-containing protein [Thermomicrobiales bacterium]|nr:DUF4097 family beta strand repeat-containing protein [Thermomicrobiales bacterium]
MTAGQYPPPTPERLREPTGSEPWFIPADTPGDPVPPRGRVSWYVPVLGRFLMLGAAVALLAAVVAGVFSAAPTAERTTTRTLTVTGTPSLSISGLLGNVVVQPGPPGQITVRATAHARALSHGLAERDLDRLGVDIGQNGDAVTIGGRQGAPWSAWVRDQGLDLVIEAPPTTNLQADLPAADLRVQGLSGVVRLDMTAGSVRLDDVTLGDGSSLHLNGGSVRFTGALAPGASADVRANAGSIRMWLPADTAAHLDASTDAGSIQITGWPIDPVQHDASATATGDLGPNPRGTLTVRADAGSINLWALGASPPAPQAPRPPPTPPRPARPAPPD